MTGLPADAGDSLPANAGDSLIPNPGDSATAPPVVVWITEDTWASCADAVRGLVPAHVPVVLLHVTPEEVTAAAHGAYAGLLGRGRPGRDPGTRLEDLAAESAETLLDEAARRVARPCTRVRRRGRVEREVVTAADGAGLLILARDGDRTRLGPRSLGRAGRFIVDHAPCPVLLVWPGSAPGVAAIPPPPSHRPAPHQPPGPRPPAGPPGPRRR